MYKNQLVNLFEKQRETNILSIYRINIYRKCYVVIIMFVSIINPVFALI